jgi:hypothetical protein
VEEGSQSPACRYRCSPEPEVEVSESSRIALEVGDCSSMRMRVTTLDRPQLTMMTMTRMMMGLRVHFEIEIGNERGAMRVRGTQRRRVPSW